MLKRFSVVLLLLRLTSLAVTGQNYYGQGFVALNNGDTLRGRLGEMFRIMIGGELAAVAEARSDSQGVFLQQVRVLLRAA